MAENYRSAMLEHGQRVLFWVSGSRHKSLPRGLWGSGWITGPVGAELADLNSGETFEEAASDEQTGYWLDDHYRVEARFFVPVALHVWDTPVEVDRLRAVAGLAGMELLRQPQMSNPSWLSREELTELEPLLPAWPDLGPPAEEQITVYVRRLRRRCQDEGGCRAGGHGGGHR